LTLGTTCTSACPRTDTYNTSAEKLVTSKITHSLDTTVNANKGVMRKIVTSKITHSLNTTVNANKGVTLEQSSEKHGASKITHSSVIDTNKRYDTPVDRYAEEVDTSKDACSSIITAMAREELRKYLLPVDLD
jgi:hypothetical protein